MKHANKMKHAGKLLFTVMCFLLLPGCYDQMILEDVSLSLMVGLDVNDSNNLVVYSQSPVFYKEAKDNLENASVISSSMRDSREKFDSILTGLTTGAKNQVLLIGKKLLEQKGWFRLLDLLYRDPRQSPAARVVVVDGPVKDIFNFQPKDKPRLFLHMRKLIDTASQSHITVKTKVQNLRWQMKEKGITPSITGLKREAEKVIVSGTVLLTKQGAYAANLSLQESMLMLVLQNQIKGKTLSFSIPSAKQADESEAIHPGVTFNARVVKNKVKTSFSESEFRFDVSMKFNILITSLDLMDQEDSSDKKTRLEGQIAEELKTRFEALIKKCQDNEIDPFGFGLYARAYQYHAWKEVQNNWGKTFAKAEVRIATRVEIKSFGVVE